MIKIFRHRKKALIMAGCIGAICVGLPMFAFCFKTVQAKNALKEELYKAEQEEKSRDTITLITAKTDLESGQIITASDICAYTMTVEEKTDTQSDATTNYIGKRCRLDIQAGSIMNAGIVYEGDEICADERYAEIDYAQSPSDLKENDLVDIRIFFPSGEDYVVAAHKRVESVTIDESGTVSSFCVVANESELLHLAGAYVDCASYEDAKLYAIKYLDDIQTAAVVDYPVNLSVFTLLSWDPNVLKLVNTEDNVRKREVLEGHLLGEEEASAENAITDAEKEQLLYLFE
ncbi:MAG: hypothetical protein K6G40_07625 [Eubacterium sp.]|nr:hypothetical protein [Eubacterium sp.]